MKTKEQIMEMLLNKGVILKEDVEKWGMEVSDECGMILFIRFAKGLCQPLLWINRDMIMLQPRRLYKELVEQLDKDNAKELMQLFDNTKKRIEKVFKDEIVIKRHETSFIYELNNDLC